MHDVVCHFLHSSHSHWNLDKLWNVMLSVIIIGFLTPLSSCNIIIVCALGMVFYGFRLVGPAFRAKKGHKQGFWTSNRSIFGELAWDSSCQFLGRFWAKRKSSCSQTLRVVPLSSMLLMPIWGIIQYLKFNQRILSIKFINVSPNVAIAYGEHEGHCRGRGQSRHWRRRASNSLHFH